MVLADSVLNPILKKKSYFIVKNIITLKKKSKGQRTYVFKIIYSHYKILWLKKFLNNQLSLSLDKTALMFMYTE